MEKSREKVIAQTGIIGIITNIGLSIMKAVFGIIANSISIILDAVNNLSDVLSSLITVIGIKLAGKRPNKKHPLGYGRFEYVSSLVVGIVIIATAIMALSESIKKLITPEDTNYTTTTLIILSVSIAVKIALGIYTYYKGKKVNSSALRGSGIDALSDAVITTSTLVGAIICMHTKVNIDGYLGIVISIFIFKAGFDLLFENIGELLGKRLSPDMSKALKTTILKFPEAIGVYDIFVENFGPNKYMGSAHIEIDSKMTANEIDDLTRKISYAVYEEHHIILTIGIYSIETSDEEIVNLRKEAFKIILSHDYVIQVHGFKCYKDKKLVTIDVVQDFKNKEQKELLEHLKSDLKEKFPDYEFILIQDVDLTD